MKKKPYHCCYLCGLLLLLSLAISPPGQAQSGPHVPEQLQPTHQTYFGIAYRPERRLQVTSSVSAISAESIQQTFTLNERDLKQIATYTPSHVLTNMSSQVNIRGVNSKPPGQLVNNTVYGYNPEATLTHSLTVLTNVDGLPLYAVEQLEVLKNPIGTQYGENAVSGVVSLTTRKGLDSHFSNGRYSNVYDLPKIDYSNIKNNYETSWRASLSAKLEMQPYTTTVPDNTYGNNGKLTISWVPNNDFFIEEKKYMDGNNVLRQWTDTEVYPELYTSQQTKYYNCEGMQLHSRLEFTDMYGYNFNQFELRYKSGEPDYGYFIPDSKAAPSFRQYFNPTLDTYIPNIEMPKSLQKNNTFYNYQFIPNYGACAEEEEEDDYPHNVLTFGISYRLEDFGFKTEGFIGPTASYTHFFCPSFGATADATINFGKVDPSKYTIGSYYGGVTVVPFHKSLGLDDPSTLSAHILAGYTSVTQKYMSNSNSNGNFSLKLGLGYDYNFQDNLGIRAAVDDNLVFGNGNTSSNYSFTAGLRLSF